MSPGQRFHWLSSGAPAWTIVRRSGRKTSSTVQSKLPVPRPKLLSIDWSTVRLTSDADALALWNKLGLNATDWHDKLEEVPQNKILMLPGNAAKFVYSVSVNGNTISVVRTFQINKSLFVQDEYPNLREFYNQVVAKQNEQVVLKKVQ